jgi:hypothetical protein
MGASSWLFVFGRHCRSDRLRLQAIQYHRRLPLQRLLIHANILEVSGDCPTFETDVRVWCSRLKKTLLFVRNEDGYRKTIQIRF